MKEKKEVKNKSTKKTDQKEKVSTTSKKNNAKTKTSDTKKESAPTTQKKNSTKAKTSNTKKETSTKKESAVKKTATKKESTPTTQKKNSTKAKTSDTKKETSTKKESAVKKTATKKETESPTPKKTSAKTKADVKQIPKKSSEKTEPENKTINQNTKKLEQTTLEKEKPSIKKERNKHEQPVEKSQTKKVEETKKTIEKENITRPVNKPVQKKKQKKIKKWVYVVVLIILIIIWLTSLYKIINWHLDNKEVEKQTEELNETTEVQEIEEGEIVTPPENQFDPYWDFIKMPLVSVDFDKLISENNDTVGWIFVDNSNINYPVVQGADNKYYLTHDFNKEYNDAGWIYMDYRNNNEQFDKNTIIYGHSRLDKSLFGTLRNATTEEWFNNKDNHIIKFSTPYENTMWMVFSTYTIKAEGYYLKTDFENDSEYKIWLDEMEKRSKFNYNTEVTTDNQVLTLSSCYTTDGVRVVVHAKLIKKEVR